MLPGGGSARPGVVAGDPGEPSGQKIRGVNAVLGGVTREIIFAVYKGAVEAVLQQIEDIVADEENDHVPAFRDVEAVGVADILQGHGGTAALVILRAEAVLALEDERDDIVLGGKEGIKCLAGDAGTLADLTHADAGIRFHFH